jgi:hypothetical protein
MLYGYEVKRVEEIEYNDLDKIVCQLSGERDLENFLTEYSPEKVSMELGTHRHYTKEHWLSEYDRGNIFVLKNFPSSPALKYTKDGYKIRGFNNFFFDNQLMWLINTLRPLSAPLIFRKKMNEPTNVEPIKESVSHVKKEEKGLTVFLGGAGMRGDYQYDFIKALKDVGISNVVRGNYSAFLYGKDETFHELIDTVADSSAVIFYNQDVNDPIALQFVDTRGCEVGKELEFLNMKYISYKGKTIKNEDCPNTFRYELETPSDTEFNLKNIEVDEKMPEDGQFNFIGYSWGSVIAARTALAYANKGIKVHHLVLLASPINYSLLQAVQNNKNIESVIIINLTELGDPIYAGMTDKEILNAAPSLMPQMNNGTGHFYYSDESKEGSLRRQKLAKKIQGEGLK